MSHNPSYFYWTLLIRRGGVWLTSLYEAFRGRVSFQPFWVGFNEISLNDCVNKRGVSLLNVAIIHIENWNSIDKRGAHTHKCMRGFSFSINVVIFVMLQI